MTIRWLLILALCLCAALPRHAIAEDDVPELSSWPAEADPRAVAQRIAARFLEGEHML
jgi:hypothetical protein